LPSKEDATRRSALVGRVSFDLPKELVDRISALAQRTGKSETHFVREAISLHIEDLEDLYDADQAMRDLRAGKSRLHSLEDVEKELGLDD